MSDLILLLDESGSIYPWRKNYLDCINTILSYRRKNEPSSTISIYKFHDKVNYVVKNRKISECPPLTYADYNPSGLTALYDCLTIAIENVKKGSVVLILTDGNDSYSNNSTLCLLKRRINELKNDVHFIIVNASLNDTSDTGKVLGINAKVYFDNTPSSIKRVENFLCTDLRTITDVVDLSDMFEAMDIDEKEDYLK